MFRKSAVAAAMLFVSVSPQAFGLGLGDIDMRSSLNQPMDATIELTSATAADMADIQVSLATLQQHARAGLTKAAILADFRFEVVKNSAGRPVIRVTSSELVREPYLEFLLELDWPRGRLLRQYTVLVDPPVTMPAVPAVPAAPVSQSVATPAPAPRAPLSQPVQRTVSAPTTVAAAPAPVANEYGPVRRNETLWSIASQLRPGDDISVEQMMLALLRANPHAFDGNNINRLKAGVTLNIPGRDDILSMSAREARAESQRQFAEWQELQARPAVTESAAAAPESPASEQVTAEAAAAEPADAATDIRAAAGEARLQLTAPEDDAASDAALAGDPSQAGSTQDLEALQQQLALATEEAAAGRAQSDELQSRVGELEQQITTMKRLLELKDEELARLQQSVTTEDQALAPEAAMQPEMEAPVASEEPAGEFAEPAAEAAVEAVAAPAPEPQAEAPATEAGLTERAAGLLDRLMQNPLLAGLGVLVALLLGGFLWLTARSRGDHGMLEDEISMRRQLMEEADLAAEAVDDDMAAGESEAAAMDDSTVMDEEVDSDPVTEAEVYLAYGRIQQAEDVLLAALQTQPDNADLRFKLLEVYHNGGNAAAFDQVATAFHETVGEGDSRWQKVATMGLALSPHNALYGGGMPAPEEDVQPAAGTEVAEELDLSAPAEELDLSAPVEAAPEESNTIEFTLDTPTDSEQDASEGLLDNVDEVTTKLDLARAYIDMDDADSARSILGEVMEEGNAEQKEEAEQIFSKLA